jgi:hypothetical protein
MISVFAKIIEKIMHKRLLSFLNKYSIINKSNTDSVKRNPPSLEGQEKGSSSGRTE